MSDLVYKRYDFKWDALEVILGGKSLVDYHHGLSGIPMARIEEADCFIKSYGFNLDDPIQNGEVLGNFHEAIHFIRTYFLYPENPEGLKLEIPRKILELTDVRELLLMASVSYPGQSTDTQGIALRNWSCCLLKVIHTIVHVDKDIRVNYFADIQQQIFDKFYKMVHRSKDGTLFFGKSLEDKMRIELAAFETKPKKSRESILIKMLHKPENVMEDIFDQFGIRFITKTRLNSLCLVKYLKDTMLVVPANIKPSRSKNSLVNVELLKSKIDSLLHDYEMNKITEEELNEELEGFCKLNQFESENPHSSAYYRAIQFTSRQLIKISNPLFDDVKDLKSKAEKEKLSDAFKQAVDRIDLKYLQREIRFFYPFEVQITDYKSAQENEKGLSAHSEYKKSQMQAAMKRAMGSLMNVANE